MEGQRHKLQQTLGDHRRDQVCNTYLVCVYPPVGHKDHYPKGVIICMPLEELPGLLNGRSNVGPPVQAHLMTCTNAQMHKCNHDKHNV